MSYGYHYGSAPASSNQYGDPRTVPQVGFSYGPASSAHHGYSHGPYQHAAQSYSYGPSGHSAPAGPAPPHPHDERPEWVRPQSEHWTVKASRGVNPPSATLPTSWTPTEEFLDSRFTGGSEKFEGIQMRKTVFSSAWARSKGLAGVDMTNIRLADLAYHKWDETALRFLSHGKYTAIVFTSHPAESVFLTKFLAMIRSNKWDLDDIAASFHSASGKPPLDKKSQSAESMNEVINALQAFMKEHAHSTVVKDQSTRIKELENQLKEVRGKDPATPQKERTLPLAMEPSVSIVDVVATSAPGPDLKGATDSAMKTWLKKIKASMSPEQITKLDTTIQQVLETYTVKIAKSEKPDLGQLACKWGLPSSLLAKGIKEKQLLTFCATCAFLSSVSAKSA